MRLILALCMLVGLAPPGWTQEGFVPEFVEKQLSAEGRYVRLNGVTGLLSSRANIAEITVADDTGVWLRINQAAIDWRRADLFSGKLTVNSLTASSIDVLRRPVSVGDMPTPEARAWAVPELPIVVDIGELRIDELRFANEVFGLASVLRSEGSMKLEAGNLTAALDMVRLDGAGGDARLRVSYQKIVDLFDIALDISEPEQGVIANALNLEGKPSVGLTLQGHGPVGSLDLILGLDTAGQKRVSGQAFLRRGDEGLAFEADFSATLADVVGAKYRAIFAEPVTGSIAGVRRASDWQIEAFDLAGAGLGLKADGIFAGGIFDGKIALESEGLDRFSGLVGVPLAGAGSIEASGKIAPVAGTFDLDLRGSVTDLVPGQDVVARLLRGETKLSGGLIRDAGGLRAEALRLQSARVDAVLSGAISSFGGDLTASLELVDLADLGGPVSGAATAELAVKGSAAGFEVVSKFAVPSGEVAGRTLTALELGLDGNFNNGEFDGNLAARAVVESRVARLDADMLASAEGIALSGINGDWVGATVAGAMALGSDQLLEGRVVLRADEIAEAAGVLGFQAKGSVEELEITASRRDDQQHLVLMLASAQLETGGAVFSDVAGKISVADAFGARRFEANFGSATLAVAGLNFETLRLLGDNANGVPEFDVTGRGFGATDLAVQGRILEFGPVPRIGIDAARLANAQADIALKSPSEITLAEGQFVVAPMVFSSGAGEMELAGSFGNNLAGIMNLTGFPLAASGLVVTDFALLGLVTGTVSVSGSAEMPVVRFDLTASDASSGTSRGLGLPPLNLVTTGSFAGGMLQVDTATAQGAGVNVAVDGTAPMAGAGVDLAVTVTQLDLALFDAAFGQQGVDGTLAGSAQVTGELADPAVTYDFRAAGLSLAALQAAGIGAFTAEAAGSYREGTIQLGATAVRGPGGLGLTATGAVSLKGGPLAVNVAGNVPLALVNGFLAGRGAQADGRLQVSARVGGTLAVPDVSGSLALANGTFSDSATNLRLNQVALDGRFDGQSLVIAAGSARSSAGGSMDISGSLGFGNGLVPDISMRLNNLAYADGRTVVTRLSGDLALRGPLNGGAILSGDLTLGETQVLIPEGSGANAGALLEVRHAGQSASVQATLDRVSANASTAGTGFISNVQADISLGAPGRIFVRGRGLDIEVRGALRVSGTLGDVVPVGSFDLVRGRFAILGQRFDFRQGQVTLEGNLDPTLDFRAETLSGDVTVIVTVSGSASDPSVVFSSVPQLPQDEVIALLIFNRGLGDLSPFQLLQLASAVRELNGGRDNGLFSQIRNAAGLDDLDIQTDVDGSAVVKAGKYIEENIYLELEAGSKGTTRATINLDLSDNVTAKASAGSDGESGVGVFYERDY